ncbi:MAG: hypothetical protein AMS26_21115 [Bacteroides sp. SM23_62]|nr:MAG: hypothetical protein AMS26_21115 [Bacteroides sp. SM23_62]
MPLIVQVAVGRGYSVLELISTFEEISGKKIKYTIGERRSGDIAACYADLAMANRALGCKTYFDINDMCANIWRWQSLNPNGYE